MRGTNQLKYLLILDFEATCDDTNELPRSEREIIEFPALLYSLKHNALVDSLPPNILKALPQFAAHPNFHEYVQPTLHSQLTPFCTSLTGITQSTVDQASPFPDVWSRHLTWLRDIGALDPRTTREFAFLTCGNWDLVDGIPPELKRLGLQEEDVPELFKPERAINIKTPFRELYGLKRPKGMAGMLGYLKLPLVGQHHSGIADCRNIAQIVTKMRKDGWEPNLSLDHVHVKPGGRG